MERTSARPDLIAPRCTEIRLFGRIQVVADGREVRLGGRHPQALFALMALERRPRSREAIAADLWPDGDPGSSASVRQALWLVRTAFVAAGVDPDSILVVDAESIGLRPDAEIDVDVATFEDCLGAESQPELALRLYRGDLTEGLGHECFAAERERLSDAYEDALALVAERRLRGGDYSGARAAALRLLARDPLREEAHAVLIAVYGAIGSRSQVQRQFRRLVGILERELGCAPLPETTAAYHAALERTVDRSRRQTLSAFFGSPTPTYAGRD